MQENPLITNDGITFGVLMVALAAVFYTSSLKTGFWVKFYRIIPSLLLCYLLPALFNSMGLISPEVSKVYNISKDFFLPAALVLMTLSIDLKAVIGLGPKALIMFLTATVGVIIGGPIAILIVSTFSPETVGGEGFDAVWRGLATLAGSWIGGGANQTAMLETYQFNKELYGGMVLVDIVVANIWMAVLLYGVGFSDKIDKWLRADNSAIEHLKTKVDSYAKSMARNPSLTDLMVILGIGFGAVAISHASADFFTGIFQNNTQTANSVFASGFFWIVVVATLVGLLLSFTPLKKYEGAGASKIGSVFIYILVASIGMKMDLGKLFENPLLILVGIIWMLVHIALLLIVARIIKAPFFFVAVGSKANIGGAASAPIVASAFHPALATVGVLLAVLGYALGTFGAILCAEMMRMVAP